MSTYYVDSVAGSDSNDGTSWANAKASFAGLHTTYTPFGEDVIYVSSRHVETAHTANQTWTGSVTAIPTVVISATYNTTTYERGALLQTNTGNYDITLTNSWALYGLNIKPGDDFIIAAAVDETYYCYDCKFILDANDTSAQFTFQASSGVCELCEFTTGDTASTNRSAGNWEFEASSGAQGFHQLIGCHFTNHGYSTGTILASASADLIGCDLSDCTGSGVEIVNGTSTGRVRFLNCKMPATVTWTDGSAACSLSAFNCQQGESDRIGYHSEIGGIVTVDTDTGVYLTDGASANDGNGGTQPFSWKMVTTATCGPSSGARLLEPLMVWVPDTGEQHFDVEVASNGALDSADVWMNALVLETSGSEVWTESTSRPGVHGVAGSALTTGGSWTGTGPTNTYKLRVTRTVAEAGWALVRVYVGEASTTVWVNPVVNLSPSS